MPPTDAPNACDASSDIPSSDSPSSDRPDDSAPEPDARKIDPARLLRQLGGIAGSGKLERAAGQKEFRRALREGRILKAGPNRYVLPGGKERVEAAARVAGSLALLSAAQHHGWKVKTPPSRVQVVVPRGRRLDDDRTADLEILRGPVDGVVTDKIRTVVDCLRRLPFDEALALADSALRDPDVTLDAVRAAVLSSPRTGRSRALRVLDHADPRAANTFESALRALCIIAGLSVEAQVPIEGVGTCDLVDRGRMLVIEGDSFRYHSRPEEFFKDVRRHTALARRGYRLLRFTVEDVIDDPDYVLAVLADVV